MLGPGVVVEKGAVVEDSVLIEDCVVGPEPRSGPPSWTSAARSLAGRARRRRARPARLARDEDVVLAGRDCRIGGEVAAGARLEPGTDMRS